MHDQDIRAALKLHLLDVHGDQAPLILEEVGVLQGVSRADVVLVSGLLNGYEIKSDRDTLVRLQTQQESYAECFETMTLVVGRKHATAAKKVIPRWWGIIEVYEGDEGPKITIVREPKRNVKLKLPSVLRLLWKAELAAALKSDVDSLASLARKSQQELIARVVKLMTASEVLQLVRDCLKARGDWRSGPTPFRRGDSRQSSSKSPRSRKNLDWLLSQQSARSQKLPACELRDHPQGMVTSLSLSPRPLICPNRVGSASN